MLSRAARPKRKFASAIAVRRGTVVDQWAPTPLGEAKYGAPVISHPGQWVAIEVLLERPLWLVSLYGLWETVPDSKDIYAEATLHRALSDLALLLHSRKAKRVILAGDLNIWRDYGGKRWKPRYDSVFTRLDAYGMTLAGPSRADGPPLKGCPCDGGKDCAHVRTYRYQRKANSTPLQLDFAFTRGVRVKNCVALDDERYWSASDHCPILVELS